MVRGNGIEKLILSKRQMWKAMFTDPRFQSGAITVSGPATSVGGKSSTDAYYSLTCDQQAAQQIDGNKVDGDGTPQALVFSHQYRAFVPHRGA